MSMSRYDVHRINQLRNLEQMLHAEGIADNLHRLFNFEIYKQASNRMKARPAGYYYSQESMRC